MRRPGDVPRASPHGAFVDRRATLRQMAFGRHPPHQRTIVAFNGPLPAIRIASKYTWLGQGPKIFEQLLGMRRPSIKQVSKWRSDIKRINPSDVIAPDGTELRVLSRPRAALAVFTSPRARSPERSCIARSRKSGTSSVARGRCGEIGQREDITKITAGISSAFRSARISSSAVTAPSRSKPSRSRCRPGRGRAKPLSSRENGRRMCDPMHRGRRCAKLGLTQQEGSAA